MPKINPTSLKYDTLKPGYGPRFGVSDSPSYNFKAGSKQVFAWFTDREVAMEFAKGCRGSLWDLENGIRLK